MDNIKQIVTVSGFCRDGAVGSIKTVWDEQGQWWEHGRLISGIIEKQSVKAMWWFSVIDAQNFADEIKAEFVNELRA